MTLVLLACLFVLSQHVALAVLKHPIVLQLTDVCLPLSLPHLRRKCLTQGYYSVEQDSLVLERIIIIIVVVLVIVIVVVIIIAIIVIITILHLFQGHAQVEIRGLSTRRSLSPRN